MNLSRRKILRLIGLSSFAAGTVATSGVQAACRHAKTPELADAATPATDSVEILADDTFTVQLEHAWADTQSATVVIKNTSEKAVTISQITPSYLSAEPGIFDFSAITASGSVTVEKDAEIRVPFTALGTAGHAKTVIGHFDQSIQRRLRDTLVIHTDNQKVAQVKTSLNPRIV